MLNQDEEVEDRLACVATTYERLRRGEQIEHRSQLTACLGVEVLHACVRWLGGVDANRTDANVLVTPEDLATDVGAAEAFAAIKCKHLMYADQTLDLLRFSGERFGE
jgi:hypothetical protein